MVVTREIASQAELDFSVQSERQSIERLFGRHLTPRQIDRARRLANAYEVVLQDLIRRSIVTTEEAGGLLITELTNLAAQNITLPTHRSVSSEEYYGRLGDAYGWIKTHSTNPDFYAPEVEILTDLVKERFGETEKPTVLEVGFGGVRDYPLLVESGLEYTGVDSSLAMGRLAKAMYPEGNFRRANILQLPSTFSDKFNSVYCMAVLHHIPPEQLPLALSELRRTLRDGGILMGSIRYGTGPSQDSATGLTYWCQDEKTFSPLLEQTGFSLLPHHPFINGFLRRRTPARSVRYLEFAAQRV